MSEFNFIFNSSKELVVINKYQNNLLVETAENEIDVETISGIFSDDNANWNEIISLIDKANSGNECFIHIYSNYEFYEGVISGIYSYENINDIRFSIEFRHSPVIIDNKVLSLISDKEKEGYKHFKNKLKTLLEVEEDSFTAEFLYYFFNNVYSCASELFGVYFPIRLMSRISAEEFVKRYCSDSVCNKLLKNSENVDQIEYDISKIYAEFSKMCAAIHTGEIFGLDDKDLGEEFKRRLNACL